MICFFKFLGKVQSRAKNIIIKNEDKFTLIKMVNLNFNKR